LYVADLEVRLRSAEANVLLRLFRQTRAAGSPVTIALLDRDIMRAYGRNLLLIEEAGEGEYNVLYAGAEVTDDKGEPIGQNKTSDIDPNTAGLLKAGCQEANKADDAICINHETGKFSAVHIWECLFLPFDRTPEGRMYCAILIARQYKHDHLRLMIDQMPMAVMRCAPVRDESGEIIDITIKANNNKAAEFAGRADPSSLIEASLLGIFGKSISSGSWDRHLSVIRTGRAQHFDFHVHDDHGTRWFQVHSYVDRSNLIVVMNDITEMKRALLEIEHQKKMLVEEMEQRRNLEQELWALAHLDPLTSLPNRRAFRDSAMLKLAEAQTAHRPCAIITIDIDHFKRVNDVHGHSAGDVVLRRIADIIRAPLRPNIDLIARMGGEEFTVLLPDTDMESATAFAEKLRKRVEQTVVVVGENEIQPTISLGIAMNRKSSDLEDLLERADRALYTAKRTGRNKVATEVDIQGGSKGGAASQSAA
jgi:diguanylate cyclase (GGDEF)-like protein